MRKKADFIRKKAFCCLLTVSMVMPHLAPIVSQVAVKLENMPCDGIIFF